MDVGPTVGCLRDLLLEDFYGSFAVAACRAKAEQVPGARANRISRRRTVQETCLGGVYRVLL